MNFTLNEILQATKGTLFHGDVSVRAGRICTDTRTLRPGETFLALNGKNFAGDQFIEEALAKGATGIIASETYAPTDFPSDVFLIKVWDTTEALGKIRASGARLSIRPSLRSPALPEKQPRRKCCRLYAAEFFRCSPRKGTSTTSSGFRKR